MSNSIFTHNYSHFFILLNQEMEKEGNYSSIYKTDSDNHVDRINIENDTNHHSDIFTGSLQLFSQWYKQIHGYFCIVCCILGILTNILNIVILSRKNMVTSTNCILTAIAVSDNLTMLAYIPFTLQFYCLYGTEPNPLRNNLVAVNFLQCFAYFSVMVHTISIWLTLTLAIFRCIILKYPEKRTVLCTVQRAKLAIVIVTGVAICVSVPNFFILQLKGYPWTNSSETVWILTYKLNTRMDLYLHNINFWMQAIMVKLVPAIGMTIMSKIFISKIRRQARLRSKLCRELKKRISNRRYAREKTGMLLAIAILFLITEFPHGVLSLLSGTIQGFAAAVYEPLGDFLDGLTLLTNNVNFVLYCAMNTQFRKTLLVTVIYPIKVKTDKIGLCLYYLSPYTYIPDHHLKENDIEQKTEVIGNPANVCCSSDGKLVYVSLPLDDLTIV